MNREKYMDQMDYYFRNTDKLVYEEIRKDFLEHFDLALAEGKSEDEIVRELGDPKEIYQEYKKQGIIEEKGFDFRSIASYMEKIGESFFRERDYSNLLENKVEIYDRIHRLEVRSDGFPLKIEAHEEDFIKIIYRSEDGVTLPVEAKSSVLKVGSIDMGILKKEKKWVEKVEIRLPKDSKMGITIWSLSGNLVANVGRNDITIRSGGGDVACHSFGDRAIIDTVAGNIDLSGSHQETYLKTATGKINVFASENKMDINTVSGKVDLNLSSWRKIILRTVSGDGKILIEEKKGKGAFYTISGDILIDGKNYDGSRKFNKEIEEKWSRGEERISFNSVSGSLDLRSK